MGRLSRHDAMTLERRTATLLEADPTGGTLSTLEHRQVPLERINLRAAAADEDAGGFEGIALPWNTLDSYGTRFHSSAFDDTLDSALYAFLWMHDPWDVLGAFTAEARDDGLWIAGDYDDTQSGREARVKARSGSAPGLSVGFQRLEVDEDDPNLITRARLVEVSQITARMQAVPGAGLTATRKAADTERRVAVARARLALSGRR